jgi:hypothetical protein
MNIKNKNTYLTSWEQTFQQAVIPEVVRLLQQRPDPLNRVDGIRRKIPSQSQPMQLEQSSPKSPRSFLTQNLSPNDYSATIIGVCFIEQYHCQRAPGNNYYGIMGPTGVQRYATIPDGITAISDLLARYEARGRTTIESLRGFYCVNRNYPDNICPGWEDTVLKVKAQLENL